jgi:hypothetical protein
LVNGYASATLCTMGKRRLGVLASDAVTRNDTRFTIGALHGGVLGA